MDNICIGGKSYSVIHNVLEQDHNYGNKYGYQENINTYIKYRIEFTRHQAIFDLIGSYKFKFAFLDCMEFDNINDAISMYVRLRYDESVLHLMLYTSVYHNGEIVLEEFKPDTMQTIVDKPTLKRLETAERKSREYEERLMKLERYLQSYHITEEMIDIRLKDIEK